MIPKNGKLNVLDWLKISINEFCSWKKKSKIYHLRRLHIMLAQSKVSRKNCKNVKKIAKRDKEEILT